MAAELAAGRTGLREGVSLYHMLLEGVVFDAGQQALLDDLADGALPGVREGIERVERDERWHVGFGLRCLIETRARQRALDDLLQRAERGGRRSGATPSPPPCASSSARKVAHRLHVAQLIEAPAAGVAAQGADARRVERSRAPAVAAGGRADAGDVGPGVADHGQVLGAQGAGQRHLQARGMGVGHQRRERVGREPLQQPAAVLDRGVEQADPDARRARDARQQLRRERRVRPRAGRPRRPPPPPPRPARPRRRRGPRAAARPRRPRSRRPTGRPSRTSRRCAPRPGRRAPPCRAGWACRRSRR